MLFGLFVRGLIMLIFVSGSLVISYGLTRFVAYLIPIQQISEVFLWFGAVIMAAAILMALAYSYVYKGFGSQADIIRRNPEIGNKVVLTFDDGPSDKYTPEILKVLSEKGVSATFFLVGKHVEQYPEIAKQIVEEGHEVGNHTYGHITIPNSAPPQLTAQIVRTNLIVLQNTGVFPPYLRPPRGLYDMRMRRIAKLLGQELVLWSLSSQDWHPRATTEGVVRRVLDRVNPGDIILFHDSGSLINSEGSSRRATAEALGPIIDGLREKGLEVVKLEDFMALHRT
ncbi:MAG: polysaccharide deacetylase family protein [Bacillota bacterium]